ncbi:MAG: hypothetical protein PHR35_08370, partial [Kiritimatiellae bacterium]|nr:hypothetical protein [Kiritimatiellia bacterium]
DVQVTLNRTTSKGAVNGMLYLYGTPDLGTGFAEIGIAPITGTVFEGEGNVHNYSFAVGANKFFKAVIK